MRLLSDPRLKAFCLALWTVAWGVVLYASLRPLQEMPFGLSDKTLHLTGYAVMTALAAGFCHAPAPLVLIAAGTVGASALVEVAQLYLPYRSFELLDLLANTAGALLGTAAAGLWLWLVVLPGRRAPRQRRRGSDGGATVAVAAASPRPS